jgi:hypothetical protein
MVQKSGARDKEGRRREAAPGKWEEELIVFHYVKVTSVLLQKTSEGKTESHTRADTGFLAKAWRNIGVGGQPALPSELLELPREFDEGFGSAKTPVERYRAAD